MITKISANIYNDYSFIFGKRSKTTFVEKDVSRMSIEIPLLQQKHKEANPNALQWGSFGAIRYE